MNCYQEGQRPPLQTEPSNEQIQQSETKQSSSASPSFDDDIYIEEGSKVELTYLDGARAGVTVKFWLTSMDDFNNESISIADHNKCPIFAPIAQAILDHDEVTVSYNVQKATCQS